MHGSVIVMEILSFQRSFITSNYRNNVLTCDLDLPRGLQPFKCQSSAVDLCVVSSFLISREKISIDISCESSAGR